MSSIASVLLAAALMTAPVTFALAYVGAAQLVQKYLGCRGTGGQSSWVLVVLYALAMCAVIWCGARVGVSQFGWADSS